MMRPWRAIIVTMALLSGASALARTTLGTFDGWGAFRDDSPLRCFAIAEPVRGGRGGKWRPFASIANWPQAGVRGQVHIRVSREIAPAAVVTLLIAERRFAMVAGGADVWAPDARSDAAIIAALRNARSFSVEGRAANGAGFAESYVLKGAATAIDAAALGCARG
jgi:hypothetical protein